MKLSTKISLVTVVTLLLATGIFGAIVIYRTAVYSLEQTIENYEQQVRATSYALGQEMSDNELLTYSEATRKSFINYLLKKYGSNKYIMIKEGQIVCNLTDFELVEKDSGRWSSDDVTHVIQNLEGARILIMGRNIKVEPSGDYQLLMVSDISSMYEDIAKQALLFIGIYLLLPYFFKR